MSALVYQAINAVTAELSANGIAKSHRNEEAQYQYRSIDDVMAALAPLFARHQLCALPRITERTDRQGRDALHVTVRASFDIVSALDGSRHVIETFGEALDSSDKATAKAISAAYKSAMLQAFCIPVAQDDAEAKTPRRVFVLSTAEPAEGWDAWVRETTSIFQSCESTEAIDRLCESRRRNLLALQRARPALYAEIGEVITRRLIALRPPPSSGPQTRTNPSRRKKRQDGGTCETPEAA